MTGISGKVCVVTGASSGIGEATAKALGREGATVVLAARREDRLRDLAEVIAKRGGTATWRRCDVTSIDDLEALRDHTEREHERCDVLINNAGIPGGGRFADLSLDRIEKVTATNYLSVLYATKLFLPMLLQAKGHVVNVASLAGRYALPGATVYTASKHAVVAFAESLLSDEAPDLRVTTVCPAFVPTEGFPHQNPPGFLTLTTAEVAGKIVEVVKRGRVGTVCVPAWAGPPAAVQMLAPRLYRGVAGFASRRYRPRVHSD
ncbi:MAG: SDR family NAD(P)-dependent oxidoreductase [Actinomycetota bacterium]